MEDWLEWHTGKHCLREARAVAVRNKVWVEKVIRDKRRSWAVHVSARREEVVATHLELSCRLASTQFYVV